MAAPAADKRAQTLEIVFKIAELLNTGLDKATLDILVQLCEAGVNPEALARVVQELRREAGELRAAEAAAVSQ